MIEEEIIYYIRLELHNGKNLDEIKKKLKKKGHSSDVIKKAMEEVRKDKTLYKARIETQEKLAKHKKLVMEISALATAAAVILLIAAFMFITMTPAVTENDELVTDILDPDYCGDIKLANLLLDGASKTCYIPGTPVTLQLMLNNNGIVDIQSLRIEITSERNIYSVSIDEVLLPGAMLAKIISHDDSVYGKITQLSIIPFMVIDSEITECPESRLVFENLQEC